MIAIALALGAALLLGAGGLVHIRDRRRLRAALFAQKLLPRWTQTILAYTLGPLEVLLAAVAVVTWIAGSAVALAPVGGVYLAFGGYTLVLRVRVPGAPCGCFGAPGPVTWAVVVRAWFFAVVAVATWWIGSQPTLGPRLLLLLPAMLVALAAWLLAEVTQPGRREMTLY